MKKWLGNTAVIIGFLVFFSTAWSLPASVQEEPEGYQRLLDLFRQFREFQKPDMQEGIPDYTPKAMRTQREELKDFQKRLHAIDPFAWPLSKQVDYLLVQAEMNGLQFDHDVLRPWQRDPAFYVPITFQFGPKMYGSFSLPRLPLEGDRLSWLKMKLQGIPAILTQAKSNLTDGAADLWMLGIRSKNREIGLLEDYIPKLKVHHPDLVPEAEKAMRALKEFKSWLEKKQDDITDPAGIGIENYNWYLKHVKLMPYTLEELAAVCQREYERGLAGMKLEEHRNQNLPPMKPADNAEDYIEMYNQAQKHMYDFLKKEEVLTVPDYIRLNPETSWREADVRDYFKHVLDRYPLPLKAHDFVGHHPDAVRHRQDERPIRGISRLYFIDGSRAEALATGIEEILMHLGMLEPQPHARELTYNLIAFRAARGVSDLKMHANQMTLMEGFQYNIDKTPYGWVPEDSPTLWHDIELYMRQPSYGIGYTIGSVQLQKLIGDRGHQLGKEFELKTFMDSFLDAGMIPLALTRWEMTGLDDEIEFLWDRYRDRKSKE